MEHGLSVVGRGEHRDANDGMGEGVGMGEDVCEGVG